MIGIVAGLAIGAFLYAVVFAFVHAVGRLDKPKDSCAVRWWAFAVSCLWLGCAPLRHVPGHDRFRRCSRCNMLSLAEE